MLNACILQIDGIHQVVQGHVRVAPAHARQHGGKQPEKSVNRISPKRAEQQVEPDHIRLKPGNRSEKMRRVHRVVERPAALHGESLELGLPGRNFVGKDRQAEKRIAPQLFRDMKSVFAETALAGRKSGDQTNFHSRSSLVIIPRSVILGSITMILGSMIFWGDMLAASN